MAPSLCACTPFKLSSLIETPGAFLLLRPPRSPAAAGQTVTSRSPPCPECTRGKADPSRERLGSRREEYQRAHLDAFPRRCAERQGVIEGGVKRQSARPSLALSCTRMNSTSSVCISEK